MNKTQDYSRVWALVKKKNRIAKIAALEGLTRSGIGPNFESLFSKGIVDRYKLSGLILEIVTERDKKIIRSYLARVTLDYEARDLVLALCKIGNSKDFEFLLSLFGKYSGEIAFQNHVRIADNMAKLCSKKQASRLKRFINSKEFWSYIMREQQRPSNRLPVEDIDNQAFMRRLLAACFIEKATRKDIKLIKKLLHHNYKWIAYKAADRLSKIGRTQDLDDLAQALWNLDEEKLNYSEQAFYGLCLLDKQLNKLE